SDPAIAANDLVVLEDPESLILPQNVVPVVTDKVDAAAEAAITAVIDQLSPDDLVELNRRRTEDQADSAEIATEWLTEQVLAWPELTGPLCPAHPVTRLRGCTRGCAGRATRWAVLVAVRPASLRRGERT